MWTYTAYILEKYCEKNKCDELLFKEIDNFFFDILWRKEHLSFYENSLGLYEDLDYLRELGIIEFDEKDKSIETKIKIKEKKTLSKIAKMVEDSSKLTGIRLFEEYKKRINSALESLT